MVILPQAERPVGTRASCWLTSDRLRHAKDGRAARNPGERARADEAKAATTKGCRCNGICM